MPPTGTETSADPAKRNAGTELRTPDVIRRKPNENSSPDRTAMMPGVLITEVEPPSCLQNSHAELRHLRIQRCRRQCRDDRISRVQRINDRIDPQPRRSVPRIRLPFVRFLHRLIQLFALFLAQLFT